MSGKQLKIEIISGEVNSGKTTRLIQKINELNKQNYRIGGFISHPIYMGNTKSGYMVQDLSEDNFYHLIHNQQSEIFTIKQGRFFFNENLFKELNLKIKLLLDYDYLVIDEIGPLELNNKGFYDGLIYLLNNYKNNLILVTRNKLLMDVKNRFVKF